MPEIFSPVRYLGGALPKVKVSVTHGPLVHIGQHADPSFFVDLMGQEEFSIISPSAPMCSVKAVIEEC